ncbi:45 kDa calcium-binding protein [Aphelenchoides fujianensis]|nr:45 kDa calcium-binding protein [Aphelenchoides fujianensis]
MNSLSDEVFPNEYPASTGFHEAVLQPTSGFVVFGCVSLGELCGFCVVNPDFSSSKDSGISFSENEGQLAASYDNKISYIATLGVSKKHQRRRLGSLMIHQAVEYVQTTVQSRAIFLHVRASNTKAISFYRRHGFYAYHFIPQYYHTRPEEGDLRDAWLMDADRPDHLNALPLERDGDLNRALRKELLFGASDGPKSGEKPAKEQIEEMFARADVDHDGRLSKDELKAQILSNIRRHLDKARNSSDQLFQQADTDGNGRISWNEYKAHVLVNKKLVDSEHAKEHAEEHAENLDGKSSNTPNTRALLLSEMTDEILKSFDRDADGELTVGEFTYIPPGMVAGDGRMDAEYVEARKREFQTAIDANGDGRATREELRAFLDPLNENHAEEEVDEILEFADENKDDHLTLKELLRHSDLLLSSSFVHPKTRLHDDL